MEKSRRFSRSIWQVLTKICFCFCFSIKVRNLFDLEFHFFHISFFHLDLLHPSDKILFCVESINKQNFMENI